MGTICQHVLALTQTYALTVIAGTAVVDTVVDVAEVVVDDDNVVGDVYAEYVDDDV